LRKSPEQGALLRHTGQKEAAKPHPGSKNHKMYTIIDAISPGTLKQIL
jgi:hypothetical protein